MEAVHAIHRAVSTDYVIVGMGEQTVVLLSRGCLPVLQVNYGIEPKRDQVYIDSYLANSVHLRKDAGDLWQTKCIVAIAVNVEQLVPLASIADVKSSTTLCENRQNQQITITPPPPLRPDDPPSPKPLHRVNM